MNKITLLIIAITCSMIGFIAGTYYGFKEGFVNHSLLEQVAQGALSRHQLASIEKGKVENVTHLFELSIDTGLHRYVMYEKSGNRILSEYFMPEFTSSLDSYVDLMAEYRRDHPIVFNSDWALPVESDDKETKRWKEQEYNGNEKMLLEIRELLKSRGIPESTLTSRSS